jgi:CheY-like chemotaxis protein
MKHLLSLCDVDTLLRDQARIQGEVFMTAQTRAALRAVVLPSPDANPQETPTRRLLGQLGHDVSRATTPNHAWQLMSADHVDLFVVDAASKGNRDVLDMIESLPDDRKPSQVAVFTDVMDAELRDFRRNAPSHVHVFIKPLHVHGLLNVLRQMEKQKTATA